MLMQPLVHSIANYAYAMYYSIKKADFAHDSTWQGLIFSVLLPVCKK